MGPKKAACLVCGRVHLYNWDYVTCEQNVLEETVVEMTDEEWEVVSKYLGDVSKENR